MKLIVGTLKTNDKAPYFNSKLLGNELFRRLWYSGEFSFGVRYTWMNPSLTLTGCLTLLFKSPKWEWVTSLLWELNETELSKARYSVPDPQWAPSLTSQETTSADIWKKTGNHFTVHLKHPVFENYWWAWEQRKERQWRFPLGAT